MAADYVDVCRKMFLEGGYFRCFAGGLPADDGTLFGGCGKALVLVLVELDRRKWEREWAADMLDEADENIQRP